MCLDFQLCHGVEGNEESRFRTVWFGTHAEYPLIAFDKTDLNLLLL